MTEKLDRALFRAAMTACALGLGALALQQLGVLPAAAKGWVKPIVLGAIAIGSAAELSRAVESVLGGERMRWSRRVLAVSFVFAVAGRLAEQAHWEETAGTMLGLVLLSLLSGLGVALLLDAIEGVLRATLPPTGVWAAACGGAGLLMFLGSDWAGEWTAWCATAGLVTIGVGGVMGSFARREIQRMGAPLRIAGKVPYTLDFPRPDRFRSRPPAG